MNKKESNPWTIKSSQTVYENPWIKVHHHEVVTPGGTQGIYGEVHFKNLAIAILPIDTQGNTWLVGQYRLPINQYSWEIPEGGGPLSDTPLASAKRELKEETGIQAHRWREVLRLYTSNSICDEKGIAFVATELDFYENDPDATEKLRIKKMPFSETVKMVMKNKISDALSIATILKVDKMIQSGQFKI